MLIVNKFLFDYGGAAVKPIALFEASLVVKNSDAVSFLSHVYLHFKSSMPSPLISGQPTRSRSHSEWLKASS